MYSDAVGYYKQAIDLSGNDLAKGNYYFETAKITGTNLGNSASARNYAYQARDLNSDLSPNVYILIGTLYYKSANSCSSDDYTKKIVFMVAYDMVLKARSYKMSDGLSNTVNDLLSTFKSQFPTGEEIFMQGDKVGVTQKTVGCWINETTTIRAKE